MMGRASIRRVMMGRTVRDPTLT